jgi:hypothetical protein
MRHSPINKGGNKLLSAFVSDERIRDRCEALVVRRGKPRRSRR